MQTIFDLQKALDAHKDEVTTLLQEVNELKAELISEKERVAGVLIYKEKLAAFERKLNSIEAKALSSVGDKPNKRSISEYVEEVLANSNEPLTANQIADLISEAGFVTSGKSENVPTMVRQILYECPKFRRVTKSNRRPVRFAMREAQS